MKIEFEVTAVDVLIGYGTDKILLTTTLPEGCFPYNKSGMTIAIDVAKGRGAEYVRTHFDIEPNVIVTR